MGVRVKDEGQFKEIYVKALDGLAVGTSVEYAGTTIPDELKGTWLFERGQELSRTEYAKLFSIIGTSYGAGDGSTTFNLPNKCGRVPVGLDENDTDFNTIGKTGGSKELQEHYHEKLYWGNFNTETGLNSGNTKALKLSYELNSTAKDDDFMTGKAGTGDSGNLQPYIVKNYIIKVKETRPLASHTVNAYSESESNAYSCDYVNGALDYSTDEVNTHKKWIDGKDIYRKVFNGTFADREVLLSGISSLVNAYGTVDVGTGLPRQMPYYEVYQNNSYTARLEFYQNQIRAQGLLAGVSHSITGEFTLEYTKTTQSTRSLNTYSGDIEEKKDIVIDDGNK